ncbi:putative phosphate-selective porin [Nitrospira tepida]|uniref:Phosphate-selective porin n=2 Tax=Nitrospira tepida TaxID=2973512 RepID=A0AA86MZP1_9BACT|nr:putative phosphate-selective porin [Nitrospira tepida]
MRERSQGRISHNQWILPVFWSIGLTFAAGLASAAGPADQQLADPSMIGPVRPSERMMMSQAGSVLAQASGSAEPIQMTDPVHVTGQQERVTSGQRLSIQSTTLENLLLEKGVLTQDDWIRLKAEEERRIFEQTAEMQFAGNPRWYERIRINGYTQFRYNLGASDGKFDIPLNDSFGDQQGNEFYVRRLRLVFQGQVSERVAFFIQFALEGSQQELSNREMIDNHMDFYLTKDRVHRLRMGLHRVPNSFDTYRSSTNRQELDRHESVTSGAPNERDLGIAYYWSPKTAQERYAQLAAYHNGPGDYGVFGIMVYNGQSRNRLELNKNKHVGARLAYPFQFRNGRLLETGVHGYYGYFSVPGVSQPNVASAARCHDRLTAEGGCDVKDQRFNAYIWTPPQPWGIMAEFTIGRGPQRNQQTGFVDETQVLGYYIQANYTWRYSDVGMLTPYVRWGEYYGGFKSINGAPDGQSRTWNFGLVWEPDTHLRFVADYVFKNGLNSTLVANQSQIDFDASQLRFQAQWFWN